VRALAVDATEDVAISGTIAGWRADKPITPKVVWDACQWAATRVQIEKRVSAHLLRRHCQVEGSGPKFIRNASDAQRRRPQ
jgi:hypothetical protein